MHKLDKGVIVFGTGCMGKKVLYLLRSREVPVVSCFDNNPRQCGIELFRQFSCEKPKLIDSDIPILIAAESVKVKKEIREQCAKLGYKDIREIDNALLREKVNELPDREYLELQYYLFMGESLNLDAPKTFNEKIQWLKLYDRNPLYIEMVDKVRAKEYAAKIIGEQYIIPTLGEWYAFDEIDFKRMPDQFVLKCTHDSGSASIILNKRKMDRQSLREKYEQAIHYNHYMFAREWAYKDIKPRIIAEKYLENANRYKGEIIDYKLMCFNGKVRCSFTCSERKEGRVKVTFYDADWKRMPFTRHYPASDGDIPRPDSYYQMVSLAEQLAKDIPFARIDFYEMNGQPYFGEITLYPGSGYEEFEPVIWDRILGDWLILPDKREA